MPSSLRTRVQLLVTCLIDRLFPDTGMAVARVLEKTGVDVDVPAGQTCCGQPAFNAGFLDDARAMARHTIDVFGGSESVVIPSGSCADMVIHQYPHLLADDPAYAEKARALASRAREFTQFLTDDRQSADVGASATGTLTYHACCHGLRGLNLRDQPQALLDHVHGAKTCTLEEREVCCGFGGLFAVKMSDISSAMLERKLDHVAATGADTVVVTDVSCGMHMAGGLHRRGSTVAVKHIADVLDPQGGR